MNSWEILGLGIVIGIILSVFGLWLFLKFLDSIP